MIQAVLEQRHLVPDLLADLRFGHASYAHWSCMEYSKVLDLIYPNLTFQALYDCFEETIHELRHQVQLIVILIVETTYQLTTYSLQLLQLSLQLKNYPLQLTAYSLASVELISMEISDSEIVGCTINILIVLRRCMLECYITPGWRGLSETSTLAYGPIHKL